MGLGLGVKVEVKSEENFVVRIKIYLRFVYF